MIRLAIAIAEISAAQSLLSNIMQEVTAENDALNLTHHELKKAAMNRLNKAMEHLKRIK